MVMVIMWIVFSTTVIMIIDCDYYNGHDDYDPHDHDPHIMTINMTVIMNTIITIVMTIVMTITTTIHREYGQPLSYLRVHHANLLEMTIPPRSKRGKKGENPNVQSFLRRFPPHTAYFGLHEI